MALTLYFLRHGQTELSRDDVFCGSGLDPTLTQDGRDMAQAFTEAYRSTHWNAIYTSELRRTIETAEPLCEALAIPNEARRGLNEIGYGSWEGLSKADVNGSFHDDYTKWLADPAWHAPTGGERGIEVERRAIHVVDEINERFQDGNVLVVSHKATIRIIVCSVLGIDVGRFRTRLGCPVASVSVVEFSEHGPLLKVMGDRSHLDERLRNLPGT